MCSPARSFCREFLSCHWILTYLTFNLYWVPLALFSSLLLLTLWSYFFGSLRLKLLPVWKPESSLLRHYGPYRLGCLISQCNYSLYLLLMFFSPYGSFLSLLGSTLPQMSAWAKAYSPGDKGDTTQVSALAQEERRIFSADFRGDQEAGRPSFSLRYLWLGTLPQPVLCFQPLGFTTK